ncbi:hypothetical protein ES703_18608 [subsurface metagenome]
MDYKVEAGNLSGAVREAEKIVRTVAGSRVGSSWYAVDIKTDVAIADVWLPTGKITMPPKIDSAVGESYTFTFIGKNTTGSSQSMRISASIEDPYGTEVGRSEETAEVPAGGTISVNVAVTFNAQGVYLGNCFLYIWV